MAFCVTIDYPEKTVVVEVDETRHLTSQELIERHLQQYREWIEARKLSTNQVSSEHPKEFEGKCLQQNLREVPLQLKFGYALVPAFANDIGPHRFFLDTGASKCVVSSHLAEALRLEREEKKKGGVELLANGNIMLPFLRCSPLELLNARI